MSSSPLPSSQPEPGRIPRPQRASNQAGVMRWLPGLDTLRHYDPAWLRHHIMAGLILTTMLVPVGIAYAVASGVPGIYGLYATIVPLLAYALFGPSRILVLGPDSSLAAVILAVVLPLSGGDPLRAVALACFSLVGRRPSYSRSCERPWSSSPLVAISIHKGRTARKEVRS